MSNSFFAKLYNWLTLADYDSAKERATLDVIKRHARGNVAFQSGDVMDSAALHELSVAGDKATASLKKLRGAH